MCQLGRMYHNFVVERSLKATTEYLEEKKAEDAIEAARVASLEKGGRKKGKDTTDGSSDLLQQWNQPTERMKSRRQRSVGEYA